jgi:ABC-type sugar transport system substrate-binding protein
LALRRTTWASTATRRPTSKAFIAAAEANDNVEAVVLDAGGDVARQIAQMEDLIQQEVDAIIIWPTNGEAVIPAVRKAKQAGIPVIVTNSKHRRAGFDFVKSFSGPDNITQGSRSAEIMCDKFKEMGIENEGPGRADHRSAGLHHGHRARQGLRGPPARSLPERDPDR